MSEINANILVQPIDTVIGVNENTITVTPTVTSLNVYTAAAPIAAGYNTQVQFNNYGSFGASANFTWNNLTNTLSATNLLTSSANLGNVSNVKILGGTNGYVLQTDGAGNLNWTAQTGGNGGGNGTPGGSNTQVQFNDSGSFGGNVDFTFDKTSGNLTIPGTYIGTVANANVANYAINVTGNSQPNITEVGQLGNLSVNGTVSANNYSGNGAGLSNVVSQYANLANFSVTVIGNGQPNITSVGTLTNLNVTGNTTSNNFIGTLANGNSNITIASPGDSIVFNVNGLTDTFIVERTITGINTDLNIQGNVDAYTYNVVAGNFFANSGTVGAEYLLGTIVTGYQPAITHLGILDNLSVTGNATANYFIGNVKINSNNIALGYNAGNINQNINAIAIGSQTAYSNQGNNSIAIGANSANNQSTNSIAIGYKAGQNNQSDTSIAIGYNAGNVSQGSNAIAIGTFSGTTSQNNYSIAMGWYAGNLNQGANGIAIGFLSGSYNQKSNSIAIGLQAGESNLGSNSIAIGVSAALENSLGNCIAIGYNAGKENLGNNSIAIGSYAYYNTYGNGGAKPAVNNTIVLNATGIQLDPSAPNSFYLAPIRNATANYTLVYNPSTSEITYTSTLGPNTAPGSNTDVVYNNNGFLDAVSGFTFNNTTNTVTTGNVAISGVYTGNGANLNNINGANVTGTVPFANVANNVAGANVSGTVSSATTATTAGTVTTNAQPNITSVGTLGNLTVTGNVIAGNLKGDGGNISNINAYSIVGKVAYAGLADTANAAGYVELGNQSNITTVGTLTNLSVAGPATVAGNLVTTTGPGIFGLTILNHDTAANMRSRGGGSVGAVVAISDNGGALAYWKTNSNTWAYVANNNSI